MLRTNNSISNKIREKMGTKFKGIKKEVRILDAYIKFSRAAQSIESQLSRHLAKSKLTSSQFGVLEVLCHIGPLNQKDIANKLLSSHSNLVTVIDNLEKSGLVIRERDKNDRRNFIINLTEPGRKVIGELFPKQLKLISDRFSVLTEKETDTLAKLCKKVGLNEKP